MPPHTNNCFYSFRQMRCTFSSAESSARLVCSDDFSRQSQTELGSGREILELPFNQPNDRFYRLGTGNCTFLSGEPAVFVAPVGATLVVARCEIKSIFHQENNCFYCLGTEIRCSSLNCSRSNSPLPDTPPCVGAIVGAGLCKAPCKGRVAPCKGVPAPGLRTAYFLELFRDPVRVAEYTIRVANHPPVK